MVPSLHVGGGARRISIEQHLPGRHWILAGIGGNVPTLPMVKVESNAQYEVFDVLIFLKSLHNTIHAGLLLCFNYSKSIFKPAGRHIA